MASMISASPSFSSSSATPRWIYEVFLSFYGEDTRKGFTDHLYHALQEKGILTFRDDEQLKRGEDISTELLKAIQESKFAVVVISSNYASSRWCLIELAEIVRCMKKTRLTVYPVFYHVDPSDVRKQTGSFAEAFANHARDPRVDTEMMKAWRAALTEVGNISGWDLRDRYEAIVIREIRGRILCELNCRFFSVNHNFVGIDSRVEEMMNLLNMELDEVRFIGVYGMSGVGKTTLAKVVFGSVSYQFEASCFIDSIRERSTINLDLVCLQKQLLSEIMKLDRATWDDCKGSYVITNRLCGIKVLIVLDNVDKNEQLEALVGSHAWFGLGSRIIITSKDTQLLERYADRLYKVEELNHDDASQLFSLSAFKELYLENGYVNLSKDFVYYAQGLPLALKVLGSSLNGKDIVEWNDVWNQLQIIPNGKIFNVLRIGFDGLEYFQKKLFLDIACFFKGKKLDYIFDIVGSFGFFPTSNIEVLVEKSLITISSERSIEMHDLIQKMGQEIVRLESPEEPGKRSRLWRYEDIVQVLKDNSGTDAVEAIVVELPVRVEERLRVRSFSQMKRLRILKIGTEDLFKLSNRLNNIVEWDGDDLELPVRAEKRLSVKSFSQMERLRLRKIGIENFSELSNKLSNIVEWDGDDLESMPTKELGLLHWVEFPFKSLPTDFKPDKLVELKMPGSSIKHLWKGSKSLGSLKILDLSFSRNLVETPDFSKAPKLKKINFKGCTSLVETPDFSKAPELEKINFKGCTSLSKVHRSIAVLKQLKALNFSWCKHLKRLPDKIKLESLTSLKLSGCLRLETFPDVKNMTSLGFLNLERTAIKELPSTFVNLSGLDFLTASRCKNLSTLPSDICGLSTLAYLHLSGCNRIDEFPDLSRMECLVKLEADEIGITQLPSPNLLPKNLEDYKVVGRKDISLAACYCDLGGFSKVIFSFHIKDEPIKLLHLERLKWCSRYEVMYGSSLTYGMPEWFNSKGSHKLGTGFRIPSNVDGSRKWLGYALFVVYEVPDHPPNSTTKVLDDYHFRFAVRFGTNRDFRLLPVRASLISSHKPLGFWLYIPAQWLYEQIVISNDRTNYFALDYFESYMLQMKPPRGCLVYEDNVSEWYSSIAPPGFEHEFYHHFLYYLKKVINSHEDEDQDDGSKGKKVVDGSKGKQVVDEDEDWDGDEDWDRGEDEDWWDGDED